MIEFFLADFNLPYAIALSLVMAIALLEGVGLLIGLSMNHFIEELFSIDFVSDTELPSGGLSATLGWLYLHQLPLLVWLLLFLCSFGMAGFTFNYLIILSLWVTLPVTFIISIFTTRFLAKRIANLIPKNESSATSSHSFSGMVATITIGTASKGNAAEAMLQDAYKQKHYVLVEPEDELQTFKQGTEVVLIEKKTSIWSAIEFKH